MIIYPSLPALRAIYYQISALWKYLKAAIKPVPFEFVFFSFVCLVLRSFVDEIPQGFPLRIFVDGSRGWDVFC